MALASFAAMKKIFYHFGFILSIINLLPHLIYASSPVFQEMEEIVDIAPQKSRSFGELYQSVEEKLGRMLDIVYMDHLATCRFMNDHTDNVFDRTLYWLECLKPDDFPLNWEEGSNNAFLRKIEGATAVLLNMQNEAIKDVSGEVYEIFINGKTDIKILQNIANNLDQLLLCIERNRAAIAYQNEILTGRCVRALSADLARVR